MTEQIKRRGRPPKEMAQPAQNVPDGTIACRVLRDYWPEEDQRVRAGAIVHLDAAAAMDGVEAGILARVKD
jgi:hypothetical protein